jgi:ABC-type phosphate transport system substrate-binding protein
VSLAEKAYVQASEIGWNPSLSQRTNSYGSVNGGYIYAALGKITGESTVAFSGINSFAAIKKAFDDGNLIGFASKPAFLAPPLAVPSHAYSMVGYDEITQTIKLYNPWGTWLPDQGVLTLTMSQLAENFSYYDRTTGIPGLI